jgi:CDP-4-dehydro-6-deoxyglucose reductase
MPFKVTNQSTGHSFDVEESEKILDAALRSGYTLPYNCRNGSCGTCKGKVVSGKVAYGNVDPDTLTQADKADGMALFCQATALEDLVIEAEEIDAVRDIPIRIVPCRVARMERLAHDVMGLWLSLPKNQRLQFLAGQYIDILLKDGRRRSFSLANAPHNDEFLELQIRHVPGGLFTDHVFGKMKEKDLLRFRGPLGTFFLREESDRSTIMVAGGTGFAPIKSMLEHLFYKEIARPVHLYWGVRSRNDLYQAALLEQWQEAHANFRYTPVLSEPEDDDDWKGATGWVHEAVLNDYADLSGYEVYASGPPVMVDSVKATFPEAGLEKKHLYSDSFEYAAESE